MNIEQLRHIVWAYYAQHQRLLPWREGIDLPDFAYKVLVSEFMLQQTQVPRVLPKFNQFIRAFATLGELSEAPLSEVLRQWQGLGYNRRAKYLHATAQQLVMQYNGLVPSDVDTLCRLPGVGPGTAAALRVYVHNMPTVFVETNIRTVFLYHFFPQQLAVTDNALLPYIEAAQDATSPREWYWALMDYGTFLKKTAGNHARRSAHHIRQSPFEGSRRQLRGRILKQLVGAPATYTTLQALCMSDGRFDDVLESLIREGLVVVQCGLYSLPEHQNTHDTIDAYV